jgi:multiple sugar transport system substrate-binding protein
VKVGFNPMTMGDITSQLNSQVKAGKVSINMIGGLHGDLAAIQDNLQDLSSIKNDLASAGISDDLWKLAGSLGGGGVKYIPWMQATYVVAAHKSMLEHLPQGADQNSLTYDQYLQWAVNIKTKTGKAMFGFPAGPTGLYHRWFQGFLLPSYSGHQVQAFASAEAVTAWKYMKDLWANMNPASTNYNNLQEPMARGEVLVGWDHVARLVNAPKDKPDDWVMLPAPKGPKGLGYMLVIGGFGVPNGADLSKASSVIKALAQPAPQVETLRQNAFFPVVKADLPSDLPPAISLEAKAVQEQQKASGTIVALPPVGVGAKDAEIAQVYKDTFSKICKEGGDIPTVLNAQAKTLQGILDQIKVPCWAPDTTTPGTTCSVA